MKTDIPPEYAAATVKCACGNTFETRSTIAEIHTEIRGIVEFLLDDGSCFKLSAEADRIEYGHDGTLTLIDFKTGAVPGAAEVEVGFAPQLTLEAHMALLGAFAPLPKAKNIAALYVKFGAPDGPILRPALGTRKAEALSEISKRHFADLIELLDQYRLISTPYLPRPFPKYIRGTGDYDHLSRYKEWAALGAETGGSW